MCLSFVVRFNFVLKERRMPKTSALSMSRSAIRVRERREAEREEQRYSSVLKEFVQYKYNHIIKEFDSFYEDLKSKYPKRRVYVNTNEFRLWRKQQIQKTFNSDGVKVDYFDSVDLNGKETSDSEDSEGSEQNGQHGEQQQQQEHPQEQQQHGGEQNEQHGEQQQQQEHPQEQQQHGGEQNEQHGGEQNEQHGEGNIIAAAMEYADNEINDIIRELENGGVPLHDDEGIDLDVYEELQGDIEEFDYRLEVELDGYIW